MNRLRACVEITGFPSTCVQELHDAEFKGHALDEYGYGITSDLVVSIDDPEMKKAFEGLRESKRLINGKYEGIVCSDILMFYDRDMTKNIRKRNKAGEIVFDNAFRKEGDTVYNRDGQAFFDIGIGPRIDPRTNSGYRRDEIGPACEGVDRRVEEAVRDYLGVMNEHGIVVKPSPGDKRFVDLMRECLRV